MLAYFVVFFRNGFTPGDLVTAQKNGCMAHFLSQMVLANSGEAYFTKTSPDFTNSRGQVINASQQVDAFAQAQSIVYLSIFICQAFNVGRHT
jgi:sodium/potassium-transporting ATPase subunit alpha